MSLKELKNPLIHNGTAQADRNPDALDPASVQLDERTEGQLLNFAYEFAEVVKFYDLKNEVNGNWQCFFGKSPAAMLAIIASIDVAVWEAEYCQLEVDFWTGVNAGKENYSPLINHIHALAVKLHQLCTELPEGMPLKKEMQAVIRGDLGRVIFDNRIENALERLIKYDKGTRKVAVLDNHQELKERYDRFVTKTDSSNCVKAWGLEDIFCLIADDGFKEPQPDDGCKENRKLRTLFMFFYRALVKVVQLAKAHLKTELAQNQAHPAHLTLFLAFVRLFGHLQADLNDMTRRHLNFYLERVLCLEKRKFVPDEVYTIFELSKSFSEFKLDAGALLDAKKDAEGNPRYYALKEEFVVTKSEVAIVATDGFCAVGEGDDKILKHHADINFDWTKKAKERLGRGGVVSLGGCEKEDDEVPKEVGLILAHPIFKLSDGVRTITVEFADKVDWMNAIKGIEFSTNSNAVGSFRVGADTIQLKESKLLEVTLNSLLPPVELPDTGKHAHLLGLRSPYLKIVFSSEVAKKVRVKTIEVQVSGHSKGLTIENGLGTYSTKDSFPLYGSSQNFTGNLIINSDDLNGKEGPVLEGSAKDFITINHGQYEILPGKIEYVNTIDYSAVPFLPFLELIDTPVVHQGGGLYSNIVPDFTVNYSRFDKSAAKENSARSSGTTANTNKREANDSEKNVSYLPDIKNYVNIPYTIGLKEGESPEEKEITFPLVRVKGIDFKSTSAFTSSFIGLQVFHVHPHGYEAFMLNGKTELPLTPFVDEITGSLLKDTHLYLGLKNLTPGEMISLLFEMAEGSGDYDSDLPDVDWSYQNYENGIYGWTYFGISDQILDTTKGDQASKNSLAQTGIVRLNIPTNIARGGTQINAGNDFHWIRATIKGEVNALPKIVDIRAQAARAIFTDRNNSHEHLETQLAGETISKLKAQPAAIKKVEQPFSSFGGRPREKTQAFYRRTSERMRHRDRAINLYDYERLLLEKFPEVRHAKCITHTDKNVQLRPGNVRVVVVPYVAKNHAENQLTPGFSRGKLEEMAAFLRSKAPLSLQCDGRISVGNPYYEKIWATGNLKFFPGRSPAYYLEKVKMDMQRFLAPWAFEDEHPIRFNGIIYRSEVLNFLEKLPYVDKVTDFKLELYRANSEYPANASSYSDFQSDSLFTAHPALATDSEDIRITADEICEDCQLEFLDSNICPSSEAPGS